jgi:hypothetical protein
VHSRHFPGHSNDRLATIFLLITSLQVKSIQFKSIRRCNKDNASNDPTVRGWESAEKRALSYPQLRYFLFRPHQGVPLIRRASKDPIFQWNLKDTDLQASTRQNRQRARIDAKISVDSLSALACPSSVALGSITVQGLEGSVGMRQNHDVLFIVYCLLFIVYRSWFVEFFLLKAYQVVVSSLVPVVALNQDLDVGARIWLLLKV